MLLLHKICAVLEVYTSRLQLIEQRFENGFAAIIDVECGTFTVHVLAKFL